MPGLFRRVRDNLSGNAPQPPRAQVAADQPGSAQDSPPQRAAMGDTHRDARQSALDHDHELQQALEASELEEAMAQSRLAAQTHQYPSSTTVTGTPVRPSVSDDEELKAALALSEAEAKQAEKGKAVMKRTPTEEDMERALQESARLASTSPKRKPQQYSSGGQYSSDRASGSSQQDQDAELARALYESQQLASASASSSSSQAPFPTASSRPATSGHTGTSSSGPPSAPMMPSPAAAAQVQQGSFPVSSQPPHRPPHSSSAHQQAGPSSSAAPQQAHTGSVRYPAIFHPNSSSSSSQGPLPSQSVQQQQQQQQRQQSPASHVGSSQQPQQSAQNQLPGFSQHQQQQEQGGPSSSDGVYIDGHHGSANLESMLSADEAFARALQEAELEAAGQRVSQAPSPQQKPPPQHQASRPQVPPTAVQPASGKTPAVEDQPGMCPACGRGLSSFFSDGRTIATSGRTWHASCFRCGSCQKLIDAGAQIGIGTEDRMPYHADCYRNKFGQRCTVCHDLLPCGQDGLIHFNVSSFWKEKTCPIHLEDNTPQCCSCSRRCPREEQWVTELDGRMVCLGCLSTIVRDTPDAQPLYNQILSFYQHMGMALPEKPPLMMVESAALNEAEEKEGRSGKGHSHGPVFHTRGLTLTVEYRKIQQVVTRDGRRFTQPVDLSARDRFEVTAILVLYGLPWLLTGTILAHECMHAWLRLRGITQLPLQTEEGLCQLMGLLWLESQDLSKQQGTWEEKLASYFAHQIRTDPSPVYGDGFRLALEAYQNLRNLPVLIAHVEQTGKFPV